MREIALDPLICSVESAALLGFSPIHFYSRSKRIGRWLERYKAASLDTRSTARVAPPLNPEVYGTDLLLERGLYSDQCVAASSTI